MSVKLDKNYNMPTIFTIFGATGDLNKRKLLPALLDLHKQGLLPECIKIVGIGRRPFSDNKYRDFVKESICKKGHNHTDMEIDSFLKHITYHKADFTEPESYKQLSEKLISIEDEFGQCSNKLFYLAVSPINYDIIFRQLADSGLTVPCSFETGWTRILVEKPFGEDVKTAQKLDKTLGLLFKESQIFRIDHYLGKETLQDILMFRFSNLIFEPLWNNKYIEKVEILLHEDLDIEGRGAFYDKIGALRDVGQNHMLQMLSFIAMENPVKFEAESIRKERAKVLKNIRGISKKEISGNVLRGQYLGYKNEDGVDPNSNTETYFNLKTFIDNKRWKGVPFYLDGGKGLDRKRTEIKIYFKKTTKCLCTPEQEKNHANILTFRIQPNEGISIVFWAKKLGLTTDLEPKKLSFSYLDGNEKFADAYEHILFDAIAGDQTLFTSTDEVSASWEFITPILENWEELDLIEYKKGTDMSEVKL
jgi:glucose-6-phosphate 1-dehydrogenase